MPRVDRLAATDLAVLWPEDFGWPQDVGLLALLDAGSDLDVEALRDHVALRAGVLPPRFRKVLERPRRGLGRPYWVDAAALDMQYHVRTVRLPSGAGERELLEACERVRRDRFDLRRPLWHLTLVKGLSDGRSGLFMDVHHCLVDGVAGVAALGALVDVDGPLDAPEPPSRRPAPTTTDLLFDVLLGLVRGLRDLGGAVARPRRTLSQLSRDIHAWRRMSTGGATPVASLNAAVGSRRRYALVRASLADCKAVGRAQGATVNDVLLCVLAGALRALLTARGEDPDGMLLRAAVPVALHSERKPPEGNRDGGVLLALPVGEADPVSRLRQVARDSAVRKSDAVLRGASSPFFQAGVVQRLVLRLARRQRMSNSYVANVPGPSAVLSLAGAQIREAFPIVPLIGNITVGIGALSYAGLLGITVVADADACPDLDVLVAALERDLEALVQTAVAPTSVD